MVTHPYHAPVKDILVYTFTSGVFILCECM